MVFQKSLLVVATFNPGKIPEIIENLALKNCKYLTLKDLGISQVPAETGETYEENARIKATAARLAAQQLLGDSPAAFLADDSGLEVDALGGAPGVFSSRYAGEAQDNQANMQKLLDEVKDIPVSQRTARFVCTLVYLDAQGYETVATGFCEGVIADAMRGEGGFGYDPLFLPQKFAQKRTMAELSSEEKNSISHRGVALRELRDKLVRSNRNC